MLELSIAFRPCSLKAVGLKSKCARLSFWFGDLGFKVDLKVYLGLRDYLKVYLELKC